MRCGYLSMEKMFKIYIKKSRVLLSLLCIVLVCACTNKENVEETVKETETTQVATESNVVSSYSEIEITKAIIEEQKPVYGKPVSLMKVKNNDMENGKVYISTSYDKILFSKYFADSHPALSNVIDAYNKNSEDYSYIFIEENRDIVRNMILERKEFDLEFTSESGLTLYRNDNKFFSFTNSYYEYTGGAHGSGAIIGYNFDANTGAIITAKDVFLDRNKLRDIILEKLDNEYKGQLFSDYSKTLINFFVEDRDLNFVLDYETANIIFEPYLLGPWSTGDVIVKISYNEYADIFNPTI